MDQLNITVVKEPRGMIRIIQLLFAILAFSTTCGFESERKITFACPPTTPSYGGTISYPIKYPFDFTEQYIYEKRNCSSPGKTKYGQSFDMDFASSAQFFVATGVLSFLYTIGALVFYLFFSTRYESNPAMPIADLIISAVLMIFWLSGACAWAAGVSDVKYYTSFNELSKLIDICVTGAACQEDASPKWASLNVSLIFGFANIFLWAASLWFVFKETTFHRKPVPPEQLGGDPTNYAYPGSQGGVPQQQQQQYPGNY